MKASKLKFGDCFIFKRRDPFRDPLGGIICRSVGGGQFTTCLPFWGTPVFRAFHHKDRVKLVERSN